MHSLIRTVLGSSTRILEIKACISSLSLRKQLKRTWWHSWTRSSQGTSPPRSPPGWWWEMISRKESCDQPPSVASRPYARTERCEPLKHVWCHYGAALSGFFQGRRSHWKQWWSSPGLRPPRSRALAEGKSEQTATRFTRVGMDNCICAIINKTPHSSNIKLTITLSQKMLFIHENDLSPYHLENYSFLQNNCISFLTVLKYSTRLRFNFCCLDNFQWIGGYSQLAIENLIYILKWILLFFSSIGSTDYIMKCKFNFWKYFFIFWIYHFVILSPSFKEK